MTPRAIRRRDRLHRWVWALFDAAIWFAAIYGATWLRYDFTASRVVAETTLMFAAVAVIGHLVVGAVIGPYAVGHQRGSFEETTDISRTVVVTTGGLLVWALIAEPPVVPRSVPVVAGALALVGMFAVRFLIRSWRNRHAASQVHERRVIVFGAGDAGRRLLRNMMRDDHQLVRRGGRAPARSGHHCLSNTAESRSGEAHAGDARRVGQALGVAPQAVVITEGVDAVVPQAAFVARSWPASIATPPPHTHPQRPRPLGWNTAEWTYRALDARTNKICPGSASRSFAYPKTTER